MSQRSFLLLISITLNVIERCDYFIGMLCIGQTISKILYLVSYVQSVPTKSNTNGDFYVPHTYLEIYKKSFLALIDCVSRAIALAQAFAVRRRRRVRNHKAN